MVDRERPGRAGAPSELRLLGWGFSFRGRKCGDINPIRRPVVPSSKDFGMPEGIVVQQVGISGVLGDRSYTYLPSISGIGNYLRFRLCSLSSVRLLSIQ